MVLLLRFEFFSIKIQSTSKSHTSPSMATVGNIEPLKYNTPTYAYALTKHTTHAKTNRDHHKSPRSAHHRLATAAGLLVVLCAIYGYSIAPFYARERHGDLATHHNYRGATKLPESPAHAKRNNTTYHPSVYRTGRTNR